MNVGLTTFFVIDLETGYLIFHHSLSRDSQRSDPIIVSGYVYSLYEFGLYELNQRQLVAVQFSDELWVYNIKRGLMFVLQVDNTVRLKEAFYHIEYLANRWFEFFRLTRGQSVSFPSSFSLLSLSAHQKEEQQNKESGDVHEYSPESPNPKSSSIAVSSSSFSTSSVSASSSSSSTSSSSDSLPSSSLPSQPEITNNSFKVTTNFNMDPFFSFSGVEPDKKQMLAFASRQKFQRAQTFKDEQVLKFLAKVRGNPSIVDDFKPIFERVSTQIFSARQKTPIVERVTLVEQVEHLINSLLYESLSGNYSSSGKAHLINFMFTFSDQVALDWNIDANLRIGYLLEQGGFNLLELSWLNFEYTALLSFVSYLLGNVRKALKTAFSREEYQQIREKVVVPLIKRNFQHLRESNLLEILFRTFW